MLCDCDSFKTVRIFFLDVAPFHTSKWIAFYDLLDAMKQKGLTVEGYKYSNRIHVVSALLKRNIASICEYMEQEDSPAGSDKSVKR